MAWLGDLKLYALSNEYTDKNTIHSYLQLYEYLLSPIRETAKSVLEVGVFEGGSIKLWYDYFLNATIYGCDVIDNIRIEELKNNNRVSLSLDESAYSSDFVKTNFLDKNIEFDFILDDGPHTLESQKAFIKFYVPLLSENGILIVEDVQEVSWLDELKEVTPKELKQYIKTYDLRTNKGRYDDIVFTVDKMDQLRKKKSLAQYMELHKQEEQLREEVSDLKIQLAAIDARVRRGEFSAEIRDLLRKEEQLYKEISDLKTLFADALIKLQGREIVAATVRHTQRQHRAARLAQRVGAIRGRTGPVSTAAAPAGSAARPLLLLRRHS